MKARSHSKSEASGQEFARRAKTRDTSTKTNSGEGTSTRSPGASQASASSRAWERGVFRDGRLAGKQNIFGMLVDKLRLSGVAIVDPHGAVLYANPRFGELFRGTGRHFSEKTFETGATLKDFVSALYWQELNEALKHAQRREVEGTVRVIDQDAGTGRTIQVVLFPVERSAGQEPIIGMVANEITEQLEASEALKLSEATRQSLSTKLLQAQDEERRRLARELHDSAGQELAFAVMNLESVAKDLNECRPETRKGVAETAELIRKIESEIRTFSYLLHPPLLDEMGLGSALRWYLEGFTKRTGIEVEVDLPGELRRLPTQYEIALFRVAQESLTNVFRHSGSRKARVKLAMSGDEVRLTVEDEGRNWRRGKKTAEVKPGVGIQSMRGRLEPLQGKLEIQHRAEGTRVSAKVPLQGAESYGVTEALAEVAQADGGARPAEAGTQTGRKRILIADDHMVARHGIKTLLAEEQDLEVCGEAEDGVEAVQKAKALQPDLIILDLTMPKGGGFSVAYQLKEMGMSTRILVYTTHAYGGLERLARVSGCDGYVVKSNATHDLVHGVRAVLEGRKFYPQDLQDLAKAEQGRT